MEELYKPRPRHKLHLICWGSLVSYAFFFTLILCILKNARDDKTLEICVKPPFFFAAAIARVNKSSGDINTKFLPRLPLEFFLYAQGGPLKDSTLPKSTSK